MKGTFEERMEALDRLIDNTNKLTQLINRIDGRATKNKENRINLGGSTIHPANLKPSKAGDNRSQGLGEPRTD